MRWTAVVPFKAVSSAKSRLAEHVPVDLHAALVRAMRADTLEAVRGATRVARLVLVVEHADDTRASGADLTLVQSSPGLNGAVRDGADHAAASWPTDGVVALVGDLPSLTGEALDEVLAAAERTALGFVPDAEGTGTTTVTALPGHRLDPRFGVGSAARHAAIARALPAADAARRDVDTAADLTAAVALGLGRHTAALVPELFMSARHDGGHEPTACHGEGTDRGRGQRPGG